MLNIDKKSLEVSDSFVEYLFLNILVENKELFNLLPKGDIAKNKLKIDLAKECLKKYLSKLDPLDEVNYPSEQDFTKEAYKIVKNCFTS